MPKRVVSWAFLLLLIAQAIPAAAADPAGVSPRAENRPAHTRVRGRRGTLALLTGLLLTLACAGPVGGVAPQSVPGSGIASPAGVENGSRGLRFEWSRTGRAAPLDGPDRRPWVSAVAVIDSGRIGTGMGSWRKVGAFLGLVPEDGRRDEYGG